MANSISSVLITGGTGSFGSAFIRHLLSTTAISRICVYSRGEHRQAQLRYELDADSRLRWFIGDVRDVDRLTRAMRGVDTVIHAAALKRIEVGAYNPTEMVLTNVLGTMNVCTAAVNARCRRVVGLSSDKAFQPISPYGQSKALAEGLLRASNGLDHGGPAFAVTRYGNVTGSQGSVIPYWKLLAENGVTSLPVTDPECTRFHMTMRQAVELVWNLALSMKGGEIAIPKDLPAYRLGDLVEAFGLDAEIHGLPPWEKLHESMDWDCCSADAPRLSVEDLKGIINGL